MSTNTPIPYWLSLPWARAWDWCDTIVDIQATDRAAAKAERDRE